MRSPKRSRKRSSTAAYASTQSPRGPCGRRLTQRTRGRHPKELPSMGPTFRWAGPRNRRKLRRRTCFSRRTPTPPTSPASYFRCSAAKPLALDRVGPSAMLIAKRSAASAFGFGFGAAPSRRGLAFLFLRERTRIGVGIAQVASEIVGRDEIAFARQLVDHAQRFISRWRRVAPGGRALARATRIGIAVEIFIADIGSRRFGPA